MSDSQQKTSENGRPSPFDQAESIFSDLVEQLKDGEFKTLLEKYNQEFVVAEPTTELTDDALEAIEQAKTADQLQRRCEYARKLSKAIMKRMGGSPDSELFKTAKKVLDILDGIETGAENRWRELGATTYTLVQLCRAKGEKPAETEQNAAPAKGWGMRTWIWVKRHPQSYGLMGSFIFLILFFVLGLFKEQWRNWCWGTAAFAFLGLILSLLGGRSR